MWCCKPIFGPERRPQRGMTMMEMLVSLSLLGLIMGVVLSIYITGAGAWRKGDVRSDLLQDLQVSTTRIVKDLERTSYASVSIGPSGEYLSLLSIFDDDGNFALDGNGRPIWEKWIIYYRQGDELRRTEVEWADDPNTRSTPMTIENLAPPQTVVDHANAQAADSRPVARNIYDFEAWVVPDTTSVGVRVRLLKKSGRAKPEELSLETLVRTRN